MQLKTPQRYQRGRSERRVVGNARWLWLWLVTPLIAVGGWQVYERRDALGPPVQALLTDAVARGQEQVATLNAPTPPPTIDPAQGMAQANAAWSRGAIEEAVALYRDVARAMPNDVTAHYRLGFGLVMQGRPDEALAAAEQAINANPFSSDAWALRALALDRADRPELAIASATQALSFNSANPRALAFMAEAYLDAGEIERAQTTIDRALETDPNSPEALFVNGLIVRDGLFDYATARDAFRAAYDLAPNLPYIGVELAWSEWYLQNYEVALEVLQGILETNPQNLDALFATGYVFFQAFGDPEQSLEYLNRCVTADPANRACLRYLGTVQGARGDTAAAAQTYARLMTAGTTRPADYLSAGRAFIAVGNCADAITALRAGHTLESDAAEPDPDRLSQFVDLLGDCGASVAPASFAPSSQNADPQSTAPESTTAPEATLESSGGGGGGG
jgi:tetratricopeptide (TPR) repeat protein